MQGVGTNTDCEWLVGGEQDYGKWWCSGKTQESCWAPRREKMRALRKVVADAGQVNRKGYSRRTGRTGRRDFCGRGRNAAFGPTMEAG